MKCPIHTCGGIGEFVHQNELGIHYECRNCGDWFSIDNLGFYQDLSDEPNQPKETKMKIYTAKAVKLNETTGNIEEVIPTPTDIIARNDGDARDQAILIFWIQP